MFRFPFSRACAPCPFLFYVYDGCAAVMQRCAVPGREKISGTITSLRESNVIHRVKVFCVSRDKALSPFVG